MPKVFGQSSKYSWSVLFLALFYGLVSNTESTSGIIELRNEANDCYYAEAQIGTPSQTIKFTFSTSNHLNWLRSTLENCDDDCTKDVSTGSNLFDVQASTTLSVTNLTTILLYLNRKGVGNFSNDFISVQGLQQSRLTPFVLLAAMKTNKSAECPTGGLFALSSDERYKNIFSDFDNFAFKYGLVQQNSKSFLYYNFTLTSFPGAIYLTVVDNANWVIKIDDGLHLSTGATFVVDKALIDSTSTITLLPKRIFDPIYDESWKRYCYEMDQAHYCECDDRIRSKLPTLSFQSQGKQFDIEPSMYLGHYKEGKGCKLRIGHSNVAVLGVNFIQHYTVIFDKGNKRIGFVPNSKFIPYMNLKLRDVLDGFHILSLLISIATFLILIMRIKSQLTFQQTVQGHGETELQEGVKRGEGLI